ncbi:hypothetical protein F6V25_15650 [Oryzomonas japonica]|uniref:Uncharacterized protein n=1 Tax=Oryzomonas japonica TaxID=2603858 RepID=A0A7J4ZMW0_9BACT|nr:hypothetical protein F6V25_15650 [Oryzomonas japonica]
MKIDVRNAIQSSGIETDLSPSDFRLNSGRVTSPCSKRFYFLPGPAFQYFLYGSPSAIIVAPVPMAEDHLSGLAHSLSAAMENSAMHDPSLLSLATFTTHDIAYFALIDKSGRYRFHSNPDLIGTAVQDPEAVEMALNGITKAGRVMLKRVKKSTNSSPHSIFLARCSDSVSPCNPTRTCRPPSEAE